MIIFKKMASLISFLYIFVFKIKVFGNGRLKQVLY